ncbi:hypothetical protein BC830DRAFT_1169655 [Chytriomyces sp. MP71]|nr:hypothetical protein BC830DRAFT_1169655 [Chytriomyces sp. MP71]
MASPPRIPSPPISLPPLAHLVRAACEQLSIPTVTSTIAPTISIPIQHLPQQFALAANPRNEKILKTKFVRKMAEKRRRDFLKEQCEELRELLPKPAGTKKCVTKERMLNAAYGHIIELQQSAAKKSSVVSNLEAEIRALKESMGLL